MKYLGFWVTRTGIRPINKKVEAILNMTPPKNTKQVHVYIGVINYYIDMWDRRSHILHPLTALTSPKVKCKWTDVEQRVFDEIKRTINHNTLLAYPYFHKRSNVHMDSSNHQLGALISQEGKPIAFYSRKLTETKNSYMVMKKEFLSIVKTLKEFRTILLGQQLNIYTDHKIYNLQNFNTYCVLRFRLILEYYSL